MKDFLEYFEHFRDVKFAIEKLQELIKEESHISPSNFPSKYPEELKPYKERLEKEIEKQVKIIRERVLPLFVTYIMVSIEEKYNL